MSPMNRRDFMKAGAGAAIGLAGIGPALAQEREDKASEPNLLFIMTDQQRWDALSIAGNPILKTPNLDRLAREGARFENAVSSCPVCVPARMCILTGSATETTGVRCNYDVDRKGFAKVLTFDNILAERGVWTEYYGKWHSPTWRAQDYKAFVTYDRDYHKYLDKHVPAREARDGEQIDILYSRRPYKPDPIDMRYGLPPGAEPTDEDGKPFEIIQPDCLGCLDIPAEHTPTAFCVDKTIEALERLKDQRFSITCSIHHPHSPMTPSKPYYGMYPAADMPLPASIDDPLTNSPYAIARKMRVMVTNRPNDMFRYEISNYYALVHEIDHHVGRILDKLKELGLEKNTLVIFTSDHGEMLGSHGLREKNVFFEESVRVPLLMRLPGAIPAGTVVKEPVSHLDYFPTIMDYLNVSGTTSQGRSLAPAHRGQGPLRLRLRRLRVGPRQHPELHGPNPRLEVPLLPNTRPQPPRRPLRPEERPPRDAQPDRRQPRPRQVAPQAEEMKERLIEWLKRTESPFLEAVKGRKIH